MPIVANGPSTLTRGVPLILYTAAPADLPGIFNGKIRPQSINSTGDTVLVELIGSTTGNTTEDIEVSKTLTNADDHFYITPLEAFTYYRIRVTLTAGSTSPTISLDYEINRR